jgi:hypothetical protein
LLAILQRFLLVRIFKRVLRNDAKNIKGDDVPLMVLLRTFHFDCQLVAETKGTLGKVAVLSMRAGGPWGMPKAVLRSL